MLQALVIGDPHFKTYNVNDMSLLTKDIIHIANQKQPDFIVILGDILDRHENINMNPLCDAVQFLKSLQDISKLYILIGNHDRKNNRDYMTPYHPFTALKYWNNTTIIDETKRIKILKNNIKYTFTMVPYVPNGKFKDALSLEPKWIKSICLFAHQEFVGAQMGAFTSDHGDVWDVNDPYIISGHIHDYQQLQNNILYLGTPIQHKFGDHIDKKIGLFSFNETPIKNHESCQCEFIKLNVPLKKIIHLNVHQIDKYKLDNTIEPKIIISGNPHEIKIAMKNKTITQWKKNGIKIIYKTITKEKIPIDHVEITHENYSTLLYNNIKNNDALCQLYKEIFNI